MRRRDEMTSAPCWICRQPIDYALTEGPECWEPDHFYPVVKRPDLQLDPANSMPSHQRCNRSRGDRDPEVLMDTSLGALSRRW